jgi:hypothetical protein
MTLSIIAENCYAECRKYALYYAEFHYPRCNAECHGDVNYRCEWFKKLCFMDMHMLGLLETNIRLVN